jgi:hypothetical protein
LTTAARRAAAVTDCCRAAEANGSLPVTIFVRFKSMTSNAMLRDPRQSSATGRPERDVREKPTVS